MKWRVQVDQIRHLLRCNSRKSSRCIPRLTSVLVTLPPVYYLALARTAHSRSSTELCIGCMQSTGMYRYQTEVRNNICMVIGTVQVHTKWYHNVLLNYSLFAPRFQQQVNWCLSLIHGNLSIYCITREQQEQNEVLIIYSTNR